MKPNVIINALVYFFNDIIGAIVPGLFLIGGFYLLLDTPSLDGKYDIHMSTSGKWVSITCLSFIVGHGLISVHDAIMSILTKLFPKLKYKLDDTEAFRLFTKHIEARLTNLSSLGNSLDINKFHPGDIRSIAMSISKEGGDLARRFMFISLFCNGIATALLILTIFFISKSLFYGSEEYKNIFFWIYSLLGFGLFSTFKLRGAVFQKRALNVPFPVAIAQIVSESKDEEQENSA